MASRSRLAGLLGLGLALAGAPGAVVGQTPTNRDQSLHTDLREDGYPVRSGATTVPADAAPLRDSDLVIGVAIGDEARAYPVNPMWEPAREVLNDTVAGTPVSVTWCPVAHTAAVYDSRVEGRRVELGVVGLRDGVSVLYDTGTGTWWSQVAGHALRGPMEGRELRPVPSVLTTWGRWRRLHPRTTVSVDPGAPGYRRFTEETWGWIVTLGREGPVVNEDLVAGVSGARTRRAFLLREVHRAGGVVNDVVDGDPIVVFLGRDAVTVRVLRRTVAGRVLRFRADGDSLRDEETGSTWDPMTGRAASGPLSGATLGSLNVTTALWYAWRSQWPDTTLWGEPSR